MFGVITDANLPTARAPVISNRPATEAKSNPFNPFAPRVAATAPKAPSAHVGSFVSNTSPNAPAISDVLSSDTNPFPDEVFSSPPSPGPIRSIEDFYPDSSEKVVPVPPPSSNPTPYYPTVLPTSSTSASSSMSPAAIKELQMKEDTQKELLEGRRRIAEYEMKERLLQEQLIQKEQQEQSQRERQQQQQQQSSKAAPAAIPIIAATVGVSSIQSYNPYGEEDEDLEDDPFATVTVPSTELGPFPVNNHKQQEQQQQSSNYKNQQQYDYQTKETNPVIQQQRTSLVTFAAEISSQKRYDPFASPSATTTHGLERVENDSYGSNDNSKDPFLSFTQLPQSSSPCSGVISSSPAEASSFRSFGNSIVETEDDADPFAAPHIMSRSASHQPKVPGQSGYDTRNKQLGQSTYVIESINNEDDNEYVNVMMPPIQGVEQQHHHHQQQQQQQQQQQRVSEIYDPFCTPGVVVSTSSNSFDAFSFTSATSQQEQLPQKEIHMGYQSNKQQWVQENEVQQEQQWQQQSQPFTQGQLKVRSSYTPFNQDADDFSTSFENFAVSSVSSNYNDREWQQQQNQRTMDLSFQTTPLAGVDPIDTLPTAYENIDNAEYVHVAMPSISTPLLPSKAGKNHHVSFHNDVYNRENDDNYQQQWLGNLPQKKEEEEEENFVADEPYTEKKDDAFESFSSGGFVRSLVVETAILEKSIDITEPHQEGGDVERVIGLNSSQYIQPHSINSFTSHLDNSTTCTRESNDPFTTSFKPQPQNQPQSKQLSSSFSSFDAFSSDSPIIIPASSFKKTLPQSGADEVHVPYVSSIPQQSSSFAPGPSSSFDNFSWVTPIAPSQPSGEATSPQQVAFTTPFPAQAQSESQTKPQVNMQSQNQYQSQSSHFDPFAAIETSPQQLVRPTPASPFSIQSSQPQAATDLFSPPNSISSVNSFSFPTSHQQQRPPVFQQKKADSFGASFGDSFSEFSFDAPHLQQQQLQQQKAQGLQQERYQQQQELQRQQQQELQRQQQEIQQRQQQEIQQRQQQEIQQQEEQRRQQQYLEQQMQQLQLQKQQQFAYPTQDDPFSSDPFAPSVYTQPASSPFPSAPQQPHYSSVPVPAPVTDSNDNSLDIFGTFPTHKPTSQSAPHAEPQRDPGSGVDDLSWLQGSGSQGFQGSKSQYSTAANVDPFGTQEVDFFSSSSQNQAISNSSQFQSQNQGQGQGQGQRNSSTIGNVNENTFGFDFNDDGNDPFSSNFNQKDNYNKINNTFSSSNDNKRYQNAYPSNSRSPMTTFDGMSGEEDPKRNRSESEAVMEKFKQMYDISSEETTDDKDNSGKVNEYSYRGDMEDGNQSNMFMKVNNVESSADGPLEGFIMARISTMYVRLHPVHLLHLTTSELIPSKPFE